MPAPNFTTAAAITAWLGTDADTPYAKRVQRDRAIARRLQQQDPLALVTGWWAAVRAEHPAAAAGDPAAATEQRLRHISTLVAAAATLLGLLGGSLAALATFRYDGSALVNVLVVTGTLVLVPVSLLLVSLLLLLGRAPVLGSLQDTLALASPGAWLSSLARRLAGDVPTARLYQWQQRGNAEAGGAARWQLFVLSQRSAVAFQAAALVSALLLVVFTDLAFGWSTTLNLAPDTVTRWCQVLASPWAWLLPDTVPNADLVANSRYFRGADSLPGNPVDLTNWWPFLLLTMLVWGLLPRVLALALGHWRSRKALVKALLSDPQVQALLERMRAPDLSASTDQDEPGLATQDSGSQAATEHPAGQMQLITWAAVMPPADAPAWVQRMLHWTAKDALAAGTGSLQDDRDSLAQLQPDNPAPVLVLARGWEPPMLDLLDFLDLLAQHLTAAPVLVVPVPENAENPLSAADLTAWRSQLARLGQPRIQLQTLDPGHD